jgi:hypothetical protein
VTSLARGRHLATHVKSEILPEETGDLQERSKWLVPHKKAPKPILFFSWFFPRIRIRVLAPLICSVHAFIETAVRCQL